MIDAQDLTSSAKADNVIVLFTDFGLQGPYTGPDEGRVVPDAAGYSRTRSATLTQSLTTPCTQDLLRVTAAYQIPLLLR
jgi:hypothetical protein